jgi:hypothetical protein
MKTLGFLTSCLVMPLATRNSWQYRREGDGGGSRYKLSGPGCSEGSPGPNYVAYVFVFVGSTTICPLHKLILSVEAKVTQQPTGRVSDLA